LGAGDSQCAGVGAKQGRASHEVGLMGQRGHLLCEGMVGGQLRPEAASSNTGWVDVAGRGSCPFGVEASSWGIRAGAAGPEQRASSGS
jgi:hypothetical protein